jgi:hypothetical protein
MPSNFSNLRSFDRTLLALEAVGPPPMTDALEAKRKAIGCSEHAIMFP